MKSNKLAKKIAEQHSKNTLYSLFLNHNGKVGDLKIIHKDDNGENWENTKIWREWNDFDFFLFIVNNSVDLITRTTIKTLVKNDKGKKTFLNAVKIIKDAMLEELKTDFSSLIITADRVGEGEIIILKNCLIPESEKFKIGESVKIDTKKFLEKTLKTVNL